MTFSIFTVQAVAVGLFADMRQFRLKAESAYSQKRPYMQRFLILTGLLVFAAGLAWPWLSRLPFGRLPGDIHIVREGFSFHFPIVTCVVISVLLSILFWIFRR